MIRKCTQCGKEFTLTDGEIDFYKSKNLNLPKRCKECRDKNKGITDNSVIMHYGLEKNQPSKKKQIPIINVIVIAVFVIIAITSFCFGNFGNKSANASSNANAQVQSSGYEFANADLLTQHYQKHGREVGATSESDYVAKANAVIKNQNALTKTEAEDGDTVYFLKSTGEIVFVSTRGYIRTYFIADYAYFQRT